MNLRSLYLTTICLSISLNCAAYAAPFKPNDIKVAASEILEIEVEYALKGKDLSRVVTCYAKTTGLSFSKKGSIYFRTLSDELKSIGASLKTSARNTRKYTTLKLKQDQLKALIKASSGTCKSFTVPGGGSPTPVPTSPAGPAPTAAPSNPNANFDTAGNVTDKGKLTFGIPSNFQANTVRGMSAFNKYTCSGCHSEPGGSSYSTITRAMTLDPMSTFGVSSQEIVDLVAYFNRGRTQ